MSSLDIERLKKMRERAGAAAKKREAEMVRSVVVESGVDHDFGGVDAKMHVMQPRNGISIVREQGTCVAVEIIKSIYGEPKTDVPFGVTIFPIGHGPTNHALAVGAPVVTGLAGTNLFTANGHPFSAADLWSKLNSTLVFVVFREGGQGWQMMSTLMQYHNCVAVVIPGEKRIVKDIDLTGVSTACAPSCMFYRYEDGKIFPFTEINICPVPEFDSIQVATLRPPSVLPRGVGFTVGDKYFHLDLKSLTAMCSNPGALEIISKLETFPRLLECITRTFRADQIQSLRSLIFENISHQQSPPPARSEYFNQDGSFKSYEKAVEFREIMMQRACESRKDRKSSLEGIINDHLYPCGPLRSVGSAEEIRRKKVPMSIQSKRDQTKGAVGALGTMTFEDWSEMIFEGGLVTLQSKPFGNSAQTILPDTLTDDITGGVIACEKPEVISRLSLQLGRNLKEWEGRAVPLTGNCNLVLMLPEEMAMTPLHSLDLGIKDRESVKRFRILVRNFLADCHGLPPASDEAMWLAFNHYLDTAHGYCSNVTNPGNLEFGDGLPQTIRVHLAAAIFFMAPSGNRPVSEIYSAFLNPENFNHVNIKKLTDAEWVALIKMIECLDLTCSAISSKDMGVFMVADIVRRFMTVKQGEAPRIVSSVAGGEASSYEQAYSSRVGLSRKYGPFLWEIMDLKHGKYSLRKEMSDDIRDAIIASTGIDMVSERIDVPYLQEKLKESLKLSDLQKRLNASTIIMLLFHLKNGNKEVLKILKSELSIHCYVPHLTWGDRRISTKTFCESKYISHCMRKHTKYFPGCKAPMGDETEMAIMDYDLWFPSETSHVATAEAAAVEEPVREAILPTLSLSLADEDRLVSALETMCILEGILSGEGGEVTPGTVFAQICEALEIPLCKFEKICAFAGIRVDSDGLIALAMFFEVVKKTPIGGNARARLVKIVETIKKVMDQ